MYSTSTAQSCMHYFSLVKILVMYTVIPVSVSFLITLLINILSQFSLSNNINP